MAEVPVPAVLRFFLEYQWFVDFAVYSVGVYLFTEAYYFVLGPVQETNIAVFWCLLTLAFSLYPSSGTLHGAGGTQAPPPCPSTVLAAGSPTATDLPQGQRMRPSWWGTPGSPSGYQVKRSSLHCYTVHPVWLSCNCSVRAGRGPWTHTREAGVLSASPPKGKSPAF